MTDEIRRAIAEAGDLGRRAEALLVLPRNPDDLETLRIDLETALAAALVDEKERLMGLGSAEEYWQAHIRRTAYKALIHALYGLPTPEAN